MQHLLHQYFQNYRLLQKELNEVLKPYGLYSSQWSVLYVLHEHGPMTLTQIWRYLHVEAPTITRTVNRLQQLKFVEKVEGADRREKTVQLTDFAIEKMPAIINATRKFEEKFKVRLTSQETSQLINLLEKMRGD